MVVDVWHWLPTFWIRGGEGEEGVEGILGTEGRLGTQALAR